MSAILKHTGQVVWWVNTTGSDQVQGYIAELESGTNYVGVVMEQTQADTTGADVSIAGAYEIPKKTATETGVSGDRVSIDAAAQDASVDVAGNHRLAKDTANGDTTMIVLINSV